MAKKKKEKGVYCLLCEDYEKINCNCIKPITERGELINRIESKIRLTKIKLKHFHSEKTELETQLKTLEGKLKKANHTEEIQTGLFT